MAAMAACPRCRTELARSHGEEGNSWTCASCGGRAVSLAVLRKTARDGVASGIWQDARLSPRAGDLACPWCARRMDRVADEEVVSGTELDVCIPCQFVWFDASEAERVPPRERPAPQPGLSPAAAEAIAVAQVRASQARFVDEPDEDPGIVKSAFGLPTEVGMPELEHRPWVTWGLALAAVVASIALSEDPGRFLFVGDDSPAKSAWGFQPSDPWRHDGLTPFTAFALHVHPFHLAWNAYFLLLFGDDVEDRLGPLRFLGFVALATAVGAASHALLAPNPDEVLLGSGGAVCGVAVFYALVFPNARMAFGVRAIARRWSSRITVVWGISSARFTVVFFLTMETALAARDVAGSDAANLGGAAVGLVAGLLARWWPASPEARTTLDAGRED